MIGLLSVALSFYLFGLYRRSFGHRIWHRITPPANPSSRDVDLKLAIDRHEWLVDSRHKILFCAIPKNSMSQWMKLLMESTQWEDPQTLAQPYPAFDASRSLDEACGKEREPSICGFPHGALP